MDKKKKDLKKRGKSLMGQKEQTVNLDVKVGRVIN